MKKVGARQGCPILCLARLKKVSPTSRKKFGAFCRSTSHNQNNQILHSTSPCKPEMAPEQKKRARPTAKTSQQSTKRQKIEVAHKKKDGAPKRQVAADALPWNEVEMPAMFDDAEGFFGLEEVDGVEVIKEGGIVKFLSATVAPAEVVDEDEFEGFGDDEETPEDNATEDKPAELEEVSVKKSAKESKAPKESKEAKELKDLAAEKKTKKETKKEKKAKKEAAKKEAAKKETPESEEEPEEDLALNVFKALEEDAESEGVDVSAWADLDLSQNTLAALSKLGFAKPTLIQSEAIPEILAGHDVVGKASTGSGKTLAFGIPIVESWLETYGELDEDELKETRPPTALILSPTRELAHQITEHITALCKGLTTAPWVAAVTGGLSVQKQQRQLAKADIIIGTPGRLWEVLSTSIELTASFKTIKFLVVDEADRLLTDGHFKEAEEIMGALDREVDPDEDEPTLSPRQTLVFSATFHKGLQQKLSGKKKGGASMNNNESVEYLIQKLNFREDKPKFIDVNPVSQMADRLKEGMVECAGTEKVNYLTPENFHWLTF